MAKGVVLMGSSNSWGNTRKIVDFVCERTGFDVIDLHTKNISRFDYEFNNSGDDFIPLMKMIVEKYDCLLFATPVYWYSMSGTMKIFFDRISDCLKTEKETGRKLRGKTMGMISCSEDPDLNIHFPMPFVETASYLGMHYLGDLHTWIENDLISDASEKALLHFIKNRIHPNFS